MTPPLVLVFAEGPAPRAPRTLRALRLAGFEPLDLTGSPAAALAGALERGPAWLVRAGSWLACPMPVALPPPSRTGRALCALGRTPAPAWAELLAKTGGDLTDLARRGAALPEIGSAYLEAPLASAVAARLRAGDALSDAVAACLRAARARVVRHAPLDVDADPGLRVAQIVTSLQQGGAERVAVELARELPRYGVASLLCALWAPSRRAFAAPEGALLDLSGAPGDRDARFARLARELAAWGADLAHAHLLAREDLARLAAHGFPPLVTVHNMRPGWPPDLEEIAAGEAVLLVACARAVEEEIAAARLPVPARTVWNGIDADRLARIDALRGRASALRRELGFGQGDLVLLAIANPRPQKRLHLLPAVLAAARAALAPREVRLVLAGDASPRSESGREARAALLAEIERLRVGEHVRMPGSVDAVDALLAAADIVVSPSAHEGLSLAHLEALAAGLPVVATGSGGTAELARETPALRCLPLDAGPERLARALVDAVAAPPPGGRDAVARHFTLSRMAQGHSLLYRRAAARAGGARPGDGLLVVTNNFSTGGAQSSARRLLVGLSARGVRVRAAVLEEQPHYPTPGRKALEAAGVPVLALPPPREIEPGRAVARLLDAASDDPPAAVLFWNALAEHKILLADALFDVPVFDVSPGAMYYASLGRYFDSPRPGLPYRSPREYGARLAGAIVKYGAEAEQAARLLGAPVHVIPNGVPLREGAAARPRPPREVVVMGTAARIHGHKRLDELLSALRQASPRLPDHTLRIAGGVERGQEAHHEALVAQSAGLCVEWVGEVEDTAAFLQDLDVFVLVAEPAGCPNASLEAMAAGLPVIATDVGGMSEQIVDGESGRLAPRGDPRALAEAMVEVCGDAALRARLGRAARERVAARFSLARMVGDYRRVCLGETG